jgi:hypothetical protein
MGSIDRCWKAPCPPFPVTTAVNPIFAGATQATGQQRQAHVPCTPRAPNTSVTPSISLQPELLVVASAKISRTEASAGKRLRMDCTHFAKASRTATGPLTLVDSSSPGNAAVLNGAVNAKHRAFPPAAPLPLISIDTAPDACLYTFTSLFRRD